MLTCYKEQFLLFSVLFYFKSPWNVLLYQQKGMNSYVFLGEVHKNFARVIIEAHLSLPFAYMGMNF